MLLSLFFPIFLAHGGVFAEVQLAKGYEQGKPFDLHVAHISVEDMEGNPVVLEKQAACSFIKMMEAAKEAGHEIKINYGFRTHEQQTYWYNRYNWLCKNKDEKYCNKAALPGWSTHQRGVSVDIGRLTVFIATERVEGSKYYSRHMDGWVEKGGCWVNDDGFVCHTALYYWLLENARDYGFRKDVPGEYWHWTYEQPPEIAVGG